MTIDTNEARSYRQALAVTGQLVKSGVQTIIASPGFRNSPLVLAARRTKGLKVVSAVDERGAAFFALGIARASRAPAAVVCTSGTAVTNYFPAVTEAFHSHVPLLVLTADRPSDLVGTGANQCTDQTHIFGNHVRGFMEIEPAREGVSSVAQARYVTAKSAALSLGPTPGPVHVNIRFREPFLPDAEVARLVEIEDPPQDAWAFLPSSSGPSKEQAEAIEEVLAASKRPLIVLGPSGFGEDRLRSILAWGRKLGIPLLCESASGASFFQTENSEWVGHLIDPILESFSSGRIAPPDLLFRFGAPLTSKHLPNLLKKGRPAQIIFDEFAESREPDFYPSVMVQGGMDGWLSHMKKWRTIEALDRSWRKDIFELHDSVERKLTAHLDAIEALTEWGFYSILEKKLGPDTALFLGNSMPIRDFNSAFPRSGKKIATFSNRGQSGIDGLLASAGGMAMAVQKESHAFIGDLSTIHDLSSLALLSSVREDLCLTLWIMNNGGGEIFRVVPTAKSGARPEWFTTPQEFDLSAMAKSFRIPYTRVTSKDDLLAIDQAAFTQPGVRLIEVLVDAEKNQPARTSFRPLL